MAIAANVAAIAASKALLFPGLDARIKPVLNQFYRLIVNPRQTSLFSRFLFF